MDLVIDLGHTFRLKDIMKYWYPNCMNEHKNKLYRSIKRDIVRFVFHYDSVTLGYGDI